MAEAVVEDRRAPPPPKVATTSAYSFGTGLVIASAHFGMKCYSGGHFHWVTPDDALIEMWAVSMLPIIHLIHKIIIHHLEKLAGDEQ